MSRFAQVRLISRWPPDTMARALPAYRVRTVALIGRHIGPATV